MSIQDLAREALVSIAAENPELAVSVKYAGKTATGVRVLTNKQTQPGVYGQAGTTISTVRVSSAEIDEPERGAMVVVDGVQVYVNECRTSGGVRVLECSDTQPVEGL